MVISQLAIPGGWTEREVPVGSRTFNLLVPADPDEFLNHLVEPRATTTPHLADPYWAKLWPAATDLGAAILRRRAALAVPEQATCLELGCGSGVAGIAALAAGLQVTFSDYVPQAVELALANAARNGLGPASGLVLDWNHPPARHFELIIAADVTYDRSHIGPLLGLLDMMLAPAGEAWFGDAGRGPAAEFVSAARARGWQVALFDEHDRPLPDTRLGHYQRFVLRRAETGN